MMPVRPAPASEQPEPGTQLLHELAHCRAGDKGDTSILSLFAYRADDFPLLEIGRAHV